MDRVGALGEAAVFLDHFQNLPDPRQAAKVSYALDEVLPLSLLAVLAGADGFVDIAKFGRSKLNLLRRFWPFANGTPSHDQLGGIFAVLDILCPPLPQGSGWCSARQRSRPNPTRSSRSQSCWT